MLQAARTALANLALPAFSSTPLRISAICVTVRLVGKSGINLDDFFEWVHLVCESRGDAEGCLKISLPKIDPRGNSIASVKSRGTCLADTRRRNPTANSAENKRVFRFCVTTVYRVRINADSEATKEVNVKIFNRKGGGALQMSGITSLEMIERVQGMVMRDINLSGAGAGLFASPVTQCDMINSDFSVNFKIDCGRAAAEIFNRYGILATFDTRIYKALKAVYMWDGENIGQPGVCIHTPHCARLKNGARCCRVTICIFGTGAIIITGARTMQQLTDVHSFTLQMLKDLMPLIIQRRLPSAFADKGACDING